MNKFLISGFLLTFLIAGNVWAQFNEQDEAECMRLIGVSCKEAGDALKAAQKKPATNQKECAAYQCSIFVLSL